MSYLNLPIGTIIAWENAAIPSGWAICDGTLGTPNLVDKFVMGAAEDGDVRTTGGNATHTHTNSNTSSRSAHDHGSTKAASASTGASEDSNAGSGLIVANVGHSHTVTIQITAADAHSHTVGDAGSSSTLPKYIKRAFIRRIS